MAPAASTGTGLNWGLALLLAETSGVSDLQPAPLDYLPLCLVAVASFPLGPHSPGGSSGYVPGAIPAPHRNPETVWEDITQLLISQQSSFCWPPGRWES